MFSSHRKLHRHFLYAVILGVLFFATHLAHADSEISDGSIINLWQINSPHNSSDSVGTYNADLTSWSATDQISSGLHESSFFNDAYTVNTPNIHDYVTSTIWAFGGWYKATSTQNDNFVISVDHENENLDVSATNVSCFVNDQTGQWLTVSGGVNVNDGQPHFIVCQQDGTNFYIWVDGAMKNYASFGHQFSSHAQNVYVGGDFYGGTTQGRR